MLKKFRLPILALGTALTLMAPSMFARDHRDYRGHEWREHHRHFGVYVGPAYPYGYGYGRYYRPYGYYDAWGYWHPY